MTATLPDSVTSRRADAPSWANDSVAMGDFLFLPASSVSGGTDGSLTGAGKVISLTWSAPALEEFVATMAHLEQEFLSAWRQADLPTPPQGRAGHRYA